MPITKIVRRDLNIGHSQARPFNRRRRAGQITYLWDVAAKRAAAKRAAARKGRSSSGSSSSGRSRSLVGTIYNIPHRTMAQARSQMLTNLRRSAGSRAGNTMIRNFLKLPNGKLAGARKGRR